MLKINLLLVVLLFTLHATIAQEYWNGTKSPTSVVSRGGQTQLGVLNFRSSGTGTTTVVEHTATTGDLYIRSVASTSNGDLGNLILNDAGGNIGIGTAIPASKLSIAGGGISLFSGLTNSVDRPLISAGTITAEIRGVSATSAALDDGFLRLSAGGGTTAATKSFIDLSGYTNPTALDRSENITMGTRGVERLRIAANGNVGIGTKNPTEQLTVNGNIRAKELKVETSGWPDYVFQPDYKLPSLDVLSTQIQQSGHLPDMPSALELQEEGIDVGNMLKLQQQKIEELTLYLIDQQKQINQLSGLTQQLQKELSNEKR